jgi:hypothetical protein
MNTALGMTGNDISGVGVLTGRRAAFSRDGAGDCCAPESATLSVSEDTQNTGRKPAIQFHAGGRSEGSIELSGDVGEPRRIYLRDHQGAGLGLDATGRISAPSIAVPGGPNLKVGNSTVYGDGTNTALRQSGSVWIEHDDLTPAALNAGDIASRKGAVTTASNWWSMIARDEGGNDNASRKDAAGSLHVNDIYIRSIGKWASELDVQGASSLGRNGYKILDPATGLAMQWGFTTGVGDNRTAYFNYPFPNAVLHVNVKSYGRANGSGSGHDYVGSMTTSGFTYTAEPAGTTGIIGFAIGY